MTQAQLLLFRAGGLRLGVFLADVGRLLVEDALVAVPFGHPALAGLLRAGDDDMVPVFDLHGLVDAAAVPPPDGRANVALFPTARGPVGLRLEQIQGTASAYTALDGEAALALQAGIPPPLRATVTGAASTTDGPFSLFSPEAFLAALGV